MKIITGALPKSVTDPAPRIECWIPENSNNKVGLIILPGGGYGGLAEHEGKGYAEFFSQSGIACFVVTYRLGPSGARHPAMLEDALSAVHTVRKRAGEFGIDPDRIGVIGSSAGGHLAAHSLVAWNRHNSGISARPDFGILCYPVITAAGPFTHRGSFINLLGQAPSQELLDAVSCEKHVSSDTPPCFIWHTAEDPGVPVENSLMFASALRASHVPFELHIYAKGQHGLGLNAPYPWGQECIRWINELPL